MKKIYLFLSLIVFTGCEKESLIQEDEFSKENIVATAKDWFENNPQNNDLGILAIVDRMDWNNAISFDNQNKSIVEVPVSLKKNFIFNSTIQSSVSTNSLFFIKEPNN